MNSIDAAIPAYRGALGGLRGSPADDATAATMQVLLARDAVAQAAAGTATSEALAELAVLDDQLQAAAPLIVEAVGSETLARWRVGPPPSA